MLCDKHIFDNVIDKFGLDIHILEEDDNQFDMQFTASAKRSKVLGTAILAIWGSNFTDIAT